MLSDTKIPAMCNVCTQNRAAKQGEKISAHLVSHFCAASIAWQAPRGRAVMYLGQGTAYRTVKTYIVHSVH